MSTMESFSEVPPITEGARALLLVLDQRCLVSVLKVREDSILLTSPTRQFPIEGMQITLEFHDDIGYTSYVAEVLREPRDIGDGLLVSLPKNVRINRHREFWRVPVNLKATMKSHVHPKRVSGEVNNLSAGGILVNTANRFEDDEVLDIIIDLPGMENEVMVGKVIHSAPGRLKNAQFQVGISFISPDPVLLGFITKYIRNRIWEMEKASGYQDSTS